jgi:hypothetical protein
MSPVPPQGDKKPMKLVSKISAPLTALFILAGCSSQDSTDMSEPVASTDEVSTEAPSMDNVQVGEVQQALSFSSLRRYVGFLEGLSKPRGLRA